LPLQEYVAPGTSLWHGVHSSPQEVTRLHATQLVWVWSGAHPGAHVTRHARDDGCRFPEHV
jgi:hypothetical protein